MQFRLDPHRCPECGSIAERIVQTVGGLSRIAVTDDGTWEDDGDGCKIEWDTMHPHENEEGRVRVYCENGHSWDADELIAGADTEPTLQEKGDDIYEAVRGEVDTSQVVAQIELVRELIDGAICGASRRLGVHERHLLEGIEAILRRISGDEDENDQEGGDPSSPA